MAAFVNIPRSDTEFWEHIDSFETRVEAIAFVKEKFGADDEGRICFVSLVSDELETFDDELDDKDIPPAQSRNKGYILHWKSDNAQVRAGLKKVAMLKKRRNWCKNEGIS